MPRPYESASSLVRFQGCPYSYKLKYVDKIEPSYRDTKRNMEFGSRVHKWMDRIGNKRNYGGIPETIAPYIEALHNYLDEDGDEIIMTEQTIYYTIKDRKIKLIIDAITKKGKALEYKITKSPQWYENQISYQMRVYTLALRQAGLEVQPVYLLFENKENKLTKKFDFKKLHTHYPASTDIKKEMWEKEILFYLKFIEEAHLYGVFPPSLINCGKCEYKADCENYNGF